MKFSVKTIDGKTQEYDLPGELTVATLKQKVEKDLGIPEDSQRMILQGKVLKNELQINTYDIEGKSIHVVKSAPPTVPLAATPPSVPEQMLPPKVSYDFMYVGGTPVIPPPPGTPHLQDLAKKAADDTLSNMKQTGISNSLVTVTVHTLDSDGRPVQSSTHTSTTHTALLDNAVENSRMESQSVDYPQPLTAQAEEEIRQKRQEEEEARRRRVMLNRYRERVREQQRRGREQTYILEIYQHMTSVRRALQGAENIIEEYFSSPEYQESKEMLEYTLKLRQEAAEREKQESEDKTTGDEEPMSHGEGEGEGEGEEEGATPLEKPKKSGNDESSQYSIGEDGRPRQHILTDTGMLLPAGSALFSSLLEDIVALERRGIELQDFYAKKINAEEHYELEDYRLNNKLVTAVQRFHNALGQAFEALKKVQVQLDTEAPRIVSLTARVRSQNPLLSLLSQPLGRVRDEEESTNRNTGGEQTTSGGGGGGEGEEEGSQSIAGLLGSLMAARAAMQMMEEEESRGGNTSSQGTEGATPNQQEGNEEEKKKKEDDDDDVDPRFLPGPVALLQEMARQRQERERQQQQERTVVIQPDEPFFDVISRIRQAVGGPEAEIMPPTMVGKLIEKCFRKLTIVEVVTIFGGSADPLASIHGTLREFVKDTLLGGEEPTADNIPQAIEKFIEGLPGMLEDLQPPLPLRTDIDFSQTAKNGCRFVLKEAFELIVNTPDDDAEFAEKIYKWSDTAGTLLTCLLRDSLLSSNDLSPSLKRLAKLMFPDNDTPGVLSMLNSQSLVDKFVEDSENSDITEEEISCHFVYVGEDKMETDEPQEKGDKQEASGTQKWPQAMPKEWIPTIEKDQEQMAKMKLQPPLSTAYLSGMPSKKRKQLESGEAEPVHMSEVLGETLQSAIETSNTTPQSNTDIKDVVQEAKDNEGLVRGLGEEFHSTVRQRLQEDPDYDPEKYPSAQKFYKPEK